MGLGPVMVMMNYEGHVWEMQAGMLTGKLQSCIHLEGVLKEIFAAAEHILGVVDGK